MSNLSTRIWEDTHPSILDTNHLENCSCLKRCAIANQKLAEIDRIQRPAAIQFCQKLPWLAAIEWQMLRLYLLPSIDAEASKNSIK
jgi:magnesium-protoporphyrin IX monomethyl ester (oxidative) cyclase